MEEITQVQYISINV